MMLKQKLIVLMGALLFSTRLLAFPCFITMVKDNCWTDYTVTVDVLDAETDGVLMTIVVPQGKSWVRKSFESRPKQRFMLRATFEPPFWKAEEGRQYFAKRYWALPEEVVGETMAWNVGACFPADFSSVPLPPGAGSNCRCDKREIPPPGQ